MYKIKSHRLAKEKEKRLAEREQILHEMSVFQL